MAKMLKYVGVFISILEILMNVQTVMASSTISCDEYIKRKIQLHFLSHKNY